jgi:hypothetical protein
VHPQGEKRAASDGAAERLPCGSNAPACRGSASVAEPIDYMLKRWDRFSRFIDDGRLWLNNNAAECAARGFGLGRSEEALQRREVHLCQITVKVMGR